MSKRVRRDSAQLNLRLEPADRARIRAAIPRGSVNAVATQLIMDYVQLVEASNTHPAPTREDSAA